MSMLFVAYNHRYFLLISIGTGHVVEVILFYHNNQRKLLQWNERNSFKQS
jgi:hypothetical protein